MSRTYVFVGERSNKHNVNDKDVRFKVPWRDSQDKDVEQDGRGAVVSGGRGIWAETWNKQLFGRQGCQGPRAVLYLNCEEPRPGVAEPERHGGRGGLASKIPPDFVNCVRI